MLLLLLMMMTCLSWQSRSRTTSWYYFILQNYITSQACITTERRLNKTTPPLQSKLRMFSTVPRGATWCLRQQLEWTVASYDNRAHRRTDGRKNSAHCWRSSRRRGKKLNFGHNWCGTATDDKKLDIRFDIAFGRLTVDSFTNDEAVPYVALRPKSATNR